MRKVLLCMALVVLTACAAAPPPTPVQTAAPSPVVPSGSIRVLGYQCKDGAVAKLHLLATGPNVMYLEWSNAERCAPGT